MSNQLIKNTTLGTLRVYPKTHTEGITDKSTGKNLVEILNSFNMYFLSYIGNTFETRCQVPKDLRREGLWITYVDFNHKVITEWYNSDNIDNETWGVDTYWRQGSNKLIGDISISVNGNWVINGKETEFKATGDPIKPLLRVNLSANKLQVSYDDGNKYENLGDNPVYTLFRTANNKLLVSTDLGKTWADTSEPIAAWFRWVSGDTANSVGKIQISRDELKTWTDLSPNIINNLRIKGYVAAVGELPTSTAALGDIYMVGPTYDESDTTHDYPHYRMWVKLSSRWVDNGEYLSNVLISLTTGLETGITMSLKAITDNIAAETARAKAAEEAIIFDVSSHNDGATFESLQSLLSSDNLSILIPTSIRCGGMTIRFILSSDNTYVQYRLMSNSFNTTVTNWQGVDNEPTAGSDNLVKSEGVFSSISEETTRAKVAEHTKLNKTEFPIKNVKESGIYFVDEQGNAFMIYSNEKGLDVSKISQEMANKVLSFLTIEQGLGDSLTSVISQKAVTEAITDVKNVSEVTEDGAFLCNEKGEVFARFVDGKFEAIGDNSGGADIKKIEDIENVEGGNIGDFLQKQVSGKWAGSPIIFPQSGINDLTDVNINPTEGDILQYTNGKWVNAHIDTSGIITTDKRTSHPLYGKSFIVIGDSHQASEYFFPYLAELTGSTYHKTSTKIIEGVEYFIVDDNMDNKVISKAAYPYDWAAEIQQVYDLGINVDYLIIENCHFGLKDNWTNLPSQYPFSGYECVEYPKFNSREQYSNTVNYSNWANIISELNINSIKKTILFQYLTSASQRISFSFTSGSVLTSDTTISIRIGNGTQMDTQLSSGMSLEECVFAINDWAFSENSDWNNPDKGVAGLTEITLTYVGGGEGNPEEKAHVSQSTETNLQVTVESTTAYQKFHRVYKLPDIAGISDMNNWVATGSDGIGWFFPNPLMGAMYLLGKYYPNAKAVFCGIDSYSTSAAESVYADGTINANAIFNSSSYKTALESKELTKKFAETFNYQYIDIGALCGITPYNMYPTFYNYNNVHLKPEGYKLWAKTIANNIK